jgi:cell division protein FtsI/penicillin-binding protein 2
MVYSPPVQTIRLVSVGIVALSVLFCVRLYVIQVARADEFAQQAEQQAQGNTAPFDRGSIFFTTKNGTRVPAASLQRGFTLRADSSLVRDANAAFEALAPIVDLSQEKWSAFVSRGVGHKDIAQRLSPADADAVRALDVPGITIVPERWRFYPQGETAAHTLGFVGYAENAFGGRYGLERHYEDILARVGISPYANFFTELLSFARSKDGARAGDVEISLEPSVQEFLQTKLAEAQKKFSSRETAGLVINPATGAILALAAVPTFNPNVFSQEKDWRVFVNPLVENVYEFGSIMKPLTLAAGIDAGAITRESTYRDEGSLTLDGKTIYNFDKKARGIVSMQEVLNQSLNTGAAHVALAMGTAEFARSMLSFGFGDETGIDLPNEASGLVKNLESPRQIEYATASFGQGIATTPIAMVRALSVLANGGLLPNPHLAARIAYTLGVSTKPSFGEPKRVLTTETVETVTSMLVEVVDRALLGGSLAMKHWSVAAKTGTAQMATPKGGYYDDRYLHSFFGYFPAYEPRFLVFLYTVEPKGVTYASHTLAAPFFDIAKFLLNYYAVPPDR